MSTAIATPVSVEDWFENLPRKIREWMEERINPEDDYTKYMKDGRDFIDEHKIWKTIKENRDATPHRVRMIIDKALSTKECLEPEEVATLLNVKDEELWKEIFEAAGEVKRAVYDNRIVTFAPLYCSNLCVGNCLYCGFRRDNRVVKRKRLSLEEVRREAEILAGMGHKRLITSYGEHPLSDANYIADTLKTIYSVRVKAKKGWGEIRRVNVNAAPMTIEELEMLKEIGIGTFQVFQETYHHETYYKVHPSDTIKGNYHWRLYCMHRALEAGVDDVGIGVLLGLYDWRFEVMGLLMHSKDLEEQFGVGPHTISFPRLRPAANTPFVQEAKYSVSDEDFKKFIAVVRLSVPYTGMILTAREPEHIRREVIPLGVTQTDFGSKIGIGAYSDSYTKQEAERQQFLLGDTRELDEGIRWLAEMGYIVSFCTAGYRCGRTGTKIMKLLKTGKEKVFCKLNAVLTYKEYLEDFASEETKKVGEQIVQKEIEEIKELVPERVFKKFLEYLNRIENGERDLYF